MCCGEKSHHHGKHRCYHGCGSCGCGGQPFGPAFWTKEEKIARLEQFLEELLAEVEAVKERIAALKGEG